VPIITPSLTYLRWLLKNWNLRNPSRGRAVFIADTRNDVHTRADIEGGSDHRRVEPKLWCQAAFKAFSIHPIKWSSLNGLFRKQTAPAFMARARTLSSG
jgi:hypothetical protein